MSNADACQTMSDHIAMFWELLATEHVRILIDIRCDHDPDSDVKYHWDSASFSDDVAKALVEQRRTSLIPDPAQPSVTPITNPLVLPPGVKAGDYGIKHAIDNTQRPADCGAWQGIETAPKDGTHILAYRLPVGIRFTNNTNPPTVVHWFDDPDQPGFYTSVNERAPEYPFNPTHWKPLDAPPRPTPPSTEGK